MSRLVSRILLSIFMFPLAFVLYLIVGITMANGSNESTVFVTATTVTWLAVAAYWILLWRSSVKWNRTRVWGAIGAVLGALCVGGAIGLFVDTMVRAGGGLAALLGGVLAIIFWLIATVLIWRETTAERMARIKSGSKSAITCPTCGYNLTGLSESRCPECGAKFTIDELLAMQPAADREMES